MARLRKGVAYRKLERPYTRKSKYRALIYVRASPHNQIVKYAMGNYNKQYGLRVELVSNSDVQLRHNSIESARKSANKLLETKCNNNYVFTVKMFPHHVLRENALASGAGADRMSTGMKMSFGKAIGIAAQVTKGKSIMEVCVEEKDLQVAKDALHRAQCKFPMRCLIKVSKIVPKEIEA
jgi:large subunit ribosomal protein L10e